MRFASLQWPLSTSTAIAVTWRFGAATEPRMDEPTIKRFTGFMAAAIGVRRSADDVSLEPMPDYSRSFPIPIHVRRWEARGTFSTFVRFQP
jgi:hypothetical protein